jgi:hypothetical protein
MTMNNPYPSSKFAIDGEEYEYCAKVYDTGSEYGIDGGRVSKLQIKRGGTEIVAYDRGWDVEPVDYGAEQALQHVLDLYA